VRVLGVDRGRKGVIPTGIVSALVAWATGDDERIEQLKRERDDIVEALFNGGKGIKELRAGSADTESFTWASTLTALEKLDVITDVLRELGEITTSPVTMTHANFGSIER
jgi:hypothetical protein